MNGTLVHRDFTSTRATGYNSPMTSGTDPSRKYPVRTNLRIVLWLLYRRAIRKPVKEPVCGKCRYPLHGITGESCPECGAEYANCGVIREGHFDGWMISALLVLLASTVLVLVTKRPLDFKDAWSRHIYVERYGTVVIEWTFTDGPIQSIEARGVTDSVSWPWQSYHSDATHLHALTLYIGELPPEVAFGSTRYQPKPDQQMHFWQPERGVWIADIYDRRNRRPTFQLSEVDAETILGGFNTLNVDTATEAAQSNAESVEQLIDLVQSVDYDKLGVSLALHGRGWTANGNIHFEENFTHDRKFLWIPATAEIVFMILCVLMLLDVLCRLRFFHKMPNA